MTPFYIAVIVVLALCAVALLVMTYMQEIIALSNKEYIILVILVLMLGCYLVYRLMPSRHLSDFQPKFYEQPHSWEKCSN